MASIEPLSECQPETDVSQTADRDDADFLQLRLKYTPRWVAGSAMGRY